MGINRDNPNLWKNDILQSVDLYNSWFMEFAPRAFRETRVTTASSVERALVDTSYLRNISVELLKNHPEVLPILRMSTCPPIARDRLVGLARVTKSLVENMEDTDTYGDAVSYSLFLCGYFDSGYLGYEAAEGIDWIWEHRINDLEQLGI